MKYAAQLAGRTGGAHLRFGVTVSDDERPDELLRPTDVSGFATMGIGEMLVHTYDLTLGLGHDWRPPRELAQAVVNRLHPGTAPVDDPSALLLWSTGRTDIDGLDRVDEWVWRASVR